MCLISSSFLNHGRKILICGVDFFNPWIKIDPLNVFGVINMNVRKVFSPRRLATALEDPTIRISGVAEVADMSVQAVYKLRDGKSKPYADTVGGLAFALKKPIDFFYEEVDLVRQLQLDSNAVSDGRRPRHGSKKTDEVR